MGEGPELSLREVLEQAPDLRRLRSRRHPLAAKVALAVCAMPGGGAVGKSLPNGGGRIRSLARFLDFTREQPPGVAPLPPAFRRMAGAAFAAALSRWGLAALAAGSVHLGRRRQSPAGAAWRFPYCCTLPNPDLPYILPPAVINVNTP